MRNAGELSNRLIDDLGNTSRYLLLTNNPCSLQRKSKMASSRFYRVNPAVSIRKNCSDKVPDFISLVARMLGALIYALVVGWKLTLVFLSISPLIIVTFNLTVKVSEAPLLTSA